MTNNKINKLKNLILLYTNTENMTNNKQQTAVEWYIKKLLDLDYEYAKGLITLAVWSERKKSLIEQAKEKYEHEMCVFADEYASYVKEQSKEGIKGAMSSMCAWTFFKNRRR